MVKIYYSKVFSVKVPEVGLFHPEDRNTSHRATAVSRYSAKQRRNFNPTQNNHISMSIMREERRVNITSLTLGHTD